MLLKNGKCLLSDFVGVLVRNHVAVVKLLGNLILVKTFFSLKQIMACARKLSGSLLDLLLNVLECRKLLIELLKNSLELIRQNWSRDLLVSLLDEILDKLLDTSVAHVVEIQRLLSRLLRNNQIRLKQSLHLFIARKARKFCIMDQSVGQNARHHKLGNVSERKDRLSTLGPKNCTFLQSQKTSHRGIDERRSGKPNELSLLCLDNTLLQLFGDLSQLKILALHLVEVASDASSSAINLLALETVGELSHLHVATNRSSNVTDVSGQSINFLVVCDDFRIECRRRNCNLCHFVYFF